MWTSKLIFVGLFVAAVSVKADLDKPLESDDIINAVNNAKTTWTAGRNFHPSLKKNFLNNLLGAKKRPGGSRLPKYVPDEDLDELELPKNFDLRTVYPNCTGLQTLRDQGPCGSCWAVSSAAAFTDRLCIASKRSWNGQLSAENLLSCCTECGDGCDGGYLDEAWEYFQTTGLVTGGDFKSHEGCQPYTLPACEHHVNGTRKQCSAYGDKDTPKCKSNCYNKKYTTDYKDDLHHVKKPFLLSNIKAAMNEIYKNGPITAAFDVYEDFLSYKSGVYKHVTGDYEGGHAVKIIGWGVESGTNYWLVANSWNSDWGDKGFFKILRGSDECGFEDDLTGAPVVVK